jgi:catechol 2,3-dioxygenase-like lactoylglutathione lyase family enzyme
MFDHIGIHTDQFDALISFYEAALAPLGYGKLASFEDAAAFGGDKPALWIGAVEAKPVGIHIAFAAHDTAAVDRFYAAAIAAGGKDNGAPGPRPDYAPGYYAAFIIDPDGNNLEAVHRQPA